MKQHGKRKWPSRSVVITCVLLLYIVGLGLVRPWSPEFIGGTKNDNGGYGFAPQPGIHHEAVIQVYAARTRGQKGALAVHTWIATKRTGASHYVVSQVIGWRLHRAGTAVFSEGDVPDHEWYGNPPILLLDLRGPGVEALIDKVHRAVEEYPWAGEYTAWPGPNSNTFVAWVGLQVPELGLDLPATAIGKDWRPLAETVGWSASGSGVQLSIYGLLGATIGLEEGLEVNVLGLSVELDVFDLALELPSLGRVGAPPAPAVDARPATVNSSQ